MAGCEGDGGEELERPRDGVSISDGAAFKSGAPYVGDTPSPDSIPFTPGKVTYVGGTGSPESIPFTPGKGTCPGAPRAFDALEKSMARAEDTR